MNCLGNKWMKIKVPTTTYFFCVGWMRGEIFPPTTANRIFICNWNKSKNPSYPVLGYLVLKEKVASKSKGKFPMGAQWWMFCQRFLPLHHCSTPHNLKVCAWWKVPAKRFKICHILYIRKPKVAFFIIHFVQFYFFP